MKTLLRLADIFDVSKEAMARACVAYAKFTIAIIIVHDGKILRIYRRDGHFPYIAADRGQRVPTGSTYHDETLPAGIMSEMDECEPEIWLNERTARNVELLEEQVLFQRDRFALILLRAELRDEDEAAANNPRW